MSTIKKKNGGQKKRQTLDNISVEEKILATKVNGVAMVYIHPIACHIL